MIRKLVLRDFRNYSDLRLDLNSGINVFTGRNGQGKTNLLEAVFFVGMLRSFRTSRINDIKKIGSNGFYIGCEIENGSWNKQLEIEYSVKRSLKIDGSKINKASEFIRQIKTVAFSPDDIMIINGQSGLRRRFVDMFISIMEPGYLSALHDYMTALKSRNSILKNKQDVSMSKAYESILAEKGTMIINLRKKYLQMLAEEVLGLLKEFHDDKTEFSVKYRVQHAISDRESYLAKFESERTKEFQKGISLFGPQVDEIDFYYNGKLLRNFGSTGQCRLISLCLKMAEVNILARSGDNEDSGKLIILVDDVTGELDLNTKKSFFKVINKADQAFFTFTENPQDEYFENADIFSINDGKLNSKI